MFIPTGSAAFDFYGANRVGDDLFANTLLALRADTGERVWQFKAVKHDVWDRDFPVPPSLVTVTREGNPMDAVVQVTKPGHVLVFGRETGEALFPIEYREVPASDVEGEVLATTQPPPFARQVFTEDMITMRTDEAYESVLKRLRKLRSGDQFTPPSVQGTIPFPGYDGGGEWGGSAFDPSTGLLYVNSNEMPWILRLVKFAQLKAGATSRGMYLDFCASCHGQDLAGPLRSFPRWSALATGPRENYGGPVVTAGGLVFIGATNFDREFRAFNKTSGELLSDTTLTAAGNVTLAVFEVNGKQFVVIAAGGGKWGNLFGGTYVAFALPGLPS